MKIILLFVFGISIFSPLLAQEDIHLACYHQNKQLAREAELRGDYAIAIKHLREAARCPGLIIQQCYQINYRIYTIEQRMARPQRPDARTRTIRLPNLPPECTNPCFLYFMKDGDRLFNQSNLTSLEEARKRYRSARNCDNLDNKAEECINERIRLAEEKVRQQFEAQKNEAKSLARKNRADSYGYKARELLRRGERNAAFQLAWFCASRRVDSLTNPVLLQTLFNAVYLEDQPEYASTRSPFFAELPLFQKEIQALLFSPDNRHLAVWDGSNISIWNIANLKEISRFTMEKLKYWKFSDYGSYLVTTDGTVLTVLDVFQRGEEPTGYKILSNNIAAVGFSPSNEEKVVFKATDKWYTWSWRPRRSGYLKRNARPVLLDEIRGIEWYASEALVTERPRNQTSASNKIRVERKSKALAVSAPETSPLVRIRAKSTGQLYHIALPGPENDSSMLSTLASNGSYLAVCHEKKNVRIYNLNLRNGESTHFVLQNFIAPVFMADHGRYTFYRRNTNSNRLDIGTDGYHDYFTQPVPVDSNIIYNSGKFDAGEDLVVFRQERAGDGPDSLVLRYCFQNTDSSARIVMFNISPVACLALSPDNRFVVVAHADQSIYSYDILAPNRQPLQEFNPQKNATRLIFSPDGKQIAATLASVDNRNEQVHYFQIWLTGLNGQMSLFDTLHLLNSRPHQAAFSADGGQLAFACSDSTVRVFQTRPRIEESSVLYGGKSAFRSVAFGASPEGQIWIAAGNNDGAVRVWNLKGQQILAFQAHNTAVLQIAFSSDGDYLYTLAENEPVKYWALTPELLEKIALSRIRKQPPMPHEYVSEFEVEDDLPQKAEVQQLSRLPLAAAVFTSIVQNHAERSRVSFNLDKTIPEHCEKAEQIMLACDSSLQTELQPLLAEMFADWSMKSLLLGQKEKALKPARKAYRYATSGANHAERALAHSLVANDRLEEALPLYAREIYRSRDSTLTQRWSSLEDEFFDQHQDWKEALNERLKPLFNTSANHDCAASAPTECAIRGYALLLQQNNQCADCFDLQIAQLKNALRCLEKFRGQHSDPDFNRYFKQDLNALQTELFRLYVEYASFDNRTGKRDQNYAAAEPLIEKNDISIAQKKINFYRDWGQALKNDSLIEKAAALAHEQKDFVQEYDIYAQLARIALIYGKDSIAQKWIAAADTLHRKQNPNRRQNDPLEEIIFRESADADCGRQSRPGVLRLNNNFDLSNYRTDAFSPPSFSSPTLDHVKFLTGERPYYSQSEADPFSKAVIAADFHFLRDADTRISQLDSLVWLDSVGRLEYEYYLADFLTNEYFSRKDIPNCLHFSELRVLKLDTLLHLINDHDDEEIKYWRKTNLERKGSYSYHCLLQKEFDKTIQIGNAIFDTAQYWNLDTLEFYWEKVNLGNAHLLKGDIGAAKVIYDDYISNGSSRGHRTDEILKDWRDLTRLGVSFPNTAVLRKWYSEWTGLEMPEEDYHLYGIAKGSR